jgi:hypothetical protein
VATVSSGANRLASHAHAVSRGPDVAGAGAGAGAAGVGTVAGRAWTAAGRRRRKRATVDR